MDIVQMVSHEVTNKQRHLVLISIKMLKKSQDVKTHQYADSTEPATMHTYRLIITSRSQLHSLFKFGYFRYYFRHIFL